ncbi:PKD domain-containing protein [Halocola ammonii]
MFRLQSVVNLFIPLFDRFEMPTLSILRMLFLLSCMSLSISGISQSGCNDNFTIGNDTLIDCNSSVTLNATPGMDSYLWSNNQNGSSINVSSPGQYSCTATVVSGTNVVVNGDFSNGISGFDSDYDEGMGGAYGPLSLEGTYTVAPNTQDTHNDFVFCYDHTTGDATGNLLGVNGANTPGQQVWSQTVTVQPNTDYMFSVWAMSAVSDNPGELNFSVNGNQVGSNLNLPFSTCNWQNFFVIWNSGASTTADIAIENLNTLQAGNDFALDDISFVPVCSYTDTVTVTTPPDPDLASIPDVTICQGESVTLQAVSADSSSSDFIWQPGNQSGTSITVSPQFTTQYTVTVTSQTTGCQSQEQVLVTPTITPNGTILSNDTYCENGNSTNFIAITPGGEWFGNGITDSTVGTFDPGVAGSGTHTISYVVGTTCQDSTTLDVTVEPALDPTIDPVDTLCVNETPFDLSAADTGGQWSGPGITDPNVGTFDPQIAGPGTSTISYEITGQCSADDEIDIVILSPPDPTIDPISDVCESFANEIFTAAETGGVWSGPGIVDAQTGEFSPAQAGPGDHTITYEFNDICITSDTEVVSVFEDQDATISAMDSICIDAAPVQLTAVDPGGQWSGNGITNSSDGTFDPSTAGAGSWNITYTISGLCGDQDNVDIVVVDPASPITPVNPVCIDAANLMLNTVNAGGEWSGPGITDDETGEFSPSLAGAGTHTIEYAFENSFGCNSLQSIQITVNSLPTVEFTPNQMEGCQPLTIQFQNDGDSGLCEWDFGDGQTEIDCGTVSHTYTASGVYTPSLTVVDNNNCSNMVEYDDLITVFEKPQAHFSFSPDNPSTLNGEVEFTDESIGDVTEYEWEFSNGDVLTNQNPIYTFEVPGSQLINLYITDSNGCRDTVSHAIFVDEEFHVYIPNTITLNWDGLNDVLIPVFSGVSKQDFEFRIFDRWGKMIYESYDLENTVWLGGVEDYMVTPGVYNWTLKVTTTASKRVVTQKGHITVIR